MSKSFFDEIVDVPKYERFTVYGIGAFLAVILLWVYTAIPSFEKPAMIYLIMMILWIFGLSFDLIWHVNKKPNQAAVNGIGKKPVSALFWGLVAGIGFVALISLQFKPFSIIDAGVLSFLFVVIAAPFVEANFFRGVLQPTFTLLFEDWFTSNKTVAGVLAMIIVSFSFAIFHVNVFGLANIFDVGAYVPYFVFGIISTVGMYATHSVAFEYGIHGVNNLIAFFSGVV